MKALYLLTLILVSLLSPCSQKEILSADNDICRLFQDGVLLRKPGTCTDSIKCENHQSVHGTTCLNGQDWDRVNKKCNKASTESYCKSPCAKSSPTYVVDPKNCNGWFRCNGATTVSKGNCNAGLVFNQPTQMCVYPSQSNCQATYEFCDVAPNNVPFKDEVNCHKYYTCTTKGLQNYTCDTGTYYDVDLAICIPKAQVDCYKHPYPADVCGTIKLAIRNRFVSDGATCCGYFYCRDFGMTTPDKSPEWARCPDGLFFNEKEQACMAREMVKCDEDRCDGVGDGQTLSGKYGCRHYLMCEKSITKEEVECPAGLYYDINKKTCVSASSSYPACKT